MSSNRLVSVDVRGLHKLYRLNAHQGSLRSAVGNAIRRLARSNGRQLLDDQIWALENVSFQLVRGEALGIIGPNGAGKTTLLKLLSRVTRPTKGSASIRGKLAALIELGAGFHPDLTGRENVYLNGAIHGLSRKELDRKFDAIVDFSGLARFIDMPVKRYSSGMYVRLGFSVAAHTDPDVLLVDEVLAVGDIDFRRKCVAHIHRLLGQGVTVIFVSHNLTQVRAVCNRGIFLADGRVRKSGEIDQVIGSYRRWLSEGRAARVGSRKRTEPHAELDGSLKIFDIRTLDEDGKGREQFDFLEPILVGVRFMASAQMDSLNYVIRIIRSDGVRCAEIRSSILDLTRLTLKGPGLISFKLKEPRLVSDTYVIEFRIRDAEDATTLAVGLSHEFEIGAPASAGAFEGVYIPGLTSPTVSSEPEAFLD